MTLRGPDYTRNYPKGGRNGRKRDIEEKGGRRKKDNQRTNTANFQRRGNEQGGDCSQSEGGGFVFQGKGGPSCSISAAAV